MRELKKRIQHSLKNLLGLPSTILDGAGFTLIELLVVISIIGLLAGILLPNLTGMRGRARDAARKSDINQIQRALEMYKTNQISPCYPTALSALSASATYLQADPHDPKYDSACTVNCWLDYSYTSPSTGTDCLTYTLKACLENESDPQADVRRGGTDTCSTGTSFTLIQP